MKIFVTGFQRSGTTLMKDLINKHPDVKIMFHEPTPCTLVKSRNVLFNNTKHINHKIIPNNKQGTRQQIYTIDFDLRKDNWGEKIPYYTPRLLRGFNKPVWEYCIRWNQYFGNHSRIVHIVRHPLDVAMSNLKRKFVRRVAQAMKVYKAALPSVINELSGVNNIIHIQYENLLIEPEATLKTLYEFCCLRNSDEIINSVLNSKEIFRYGKVNKDRAYSFKREDWEWNQYDLNDILQKLSTLKGINYEVN